MLDDDGASLLRVKANLKILGLKLLSLGILVNCDKLRLLVFFVTF